MPAPFAMPPTRTSRPSISTVAGGELGVRVGRADRDRRLARRPAADSAPAAARMPASTRSIGSGTPITPVEQTSTSSPAPVSSPASAAIRSASARPCAPVATLALPLETHDRARRPALAARRSRHRRTGAPAAQAAREHAGGRGRAVGDHERDVGPAGGLDPARRARGPEAARVGDAYGHRPCAVRPAPSSRPEHQVRVLDRLAGGALDEVVERGGDDRGARPRGRRTPPRRRRSSPPAAAAPASRRGG